MTAPLPCRNPSCEGNIPAFTFINPEFCCDRCRVEWCVANGRARDGTPLRDPVLERLDQELDVMIEAGKQQSQRRRLFG